MIEKELSILKNSNLSRLDRYLRRMNVWRYIGLMVLITYLIELPLEVFRPMVNDYEGVVAFENMITEHPGFMILMVGILAPLAETFIFQVAVIRALQWIEKIPKLAIMLISAFIFMSVHFPDNHIIYYMWVFILGFILAYTYIIFQEREEAPFAVVFFIHAFRNMISVFVILITGPISP